MTPVVPVLPGTMLYHMHDAGFVRIYVLLPVPGTIPCIK